MRAPLHERRRFIPEVLILAAGAAAALALFGWTDLDLRIARTFYDPSAPDGPWPAAARIPWSVLHHLTPWLAAALGFLGLGLVTLGILVPARRDIGLDGLLIVLSLALGPGLVINAILKDNCKRPRPRQTLTLGGDHAYVPPFRIGPGGKSFPCGHCSVGFACGALYYALRRRRHRAARVALVSSGIGGAVIGLGRVASGGHFASDVVWSAVLTYGTIATVYYAILRVPWRAGTARAPASGAPQPARAARLPRTARAGLVVAGGSLLVFLVLLATPFEQPVGRVFAPDAEARGSWRLVARLGTGHVRLVFEPEGAVITSSGSYDGFGFPGGSLEESLTIDEPARRVVYTVEPRGWFTDLEGQVTLTIAAPSVASVEVEAADGILTIESRPGASPPTDLACRVRADALRLRGGMRRDQVRLLPPVDRSGT